MIKIQMSEKTDPDYIETLCHCYLMNNFELTQ